MPKKIRVENNVVVECMNVNEVPQGAMNSGDWRDAIEVIPELIKGRQILGSHWFDLTKNPVEIHWNIENLSIEDRKQMLLNFIDLKYKDELLEITRNSVDESVSIENFFITLTKKTKEKNTINNISTHEEIDEYINLNKII